MHDSVPWKTEETIVGLPRLLVLSVFSRFGGCHLSPCPDFGTDFYPTKVKVTDKQLATVDLHPHRFHGEWNYTIKHQIISV